MDPAHLNKLFSISNWLFLIPCYYQNSIGDLWNTLVPTKSSKSLKALESEEESTSGDSEEDPEIVQKMAMLSNKLQYLAKKNKKFLSRSSSHKSSRREEKGCFNCKKTGLFIAECPDLQKDKTKDKSKKPIFKSNKFKQQPNLHQTLSQMTNLHLHHPPFRPYNHLQTCWSLNSWMLSFWQSLLKFKG